MNDDAHVLINFYRDIVSRLEADDLTYAEQCVLVEAHHKLFFVSQGIHVKREDDTWMNCIALASVIQNMVSR